MAPGRPYLLVQLLLKGVNFDFDAKGWLAILAEIVFVARIVVP